MTDETLLLRQVHPAFVQQGRVTSQAFCPTVKDAGRLSVYDGDLISPENAWIHYTRTLGFASHGVIAVSVGECRGEGILVISDPAPFPEHAVIDFTAMGSAQIQKKSKRLKKFAEARGWLFHSAGP